MFIYFYSKKYLLKFNKFLFNVDIDLKIILVNHIEIIL